MDRFRALLNDVGDGLDNHSLTSESAARLVSQHIQQRLNCSRVSMWQCEGAAGQRVMRRVAFHDAELQQDGPGALFQLHEMDCGEYFSNVQRNSVFICGDVRIERRLGRMNALYLQPSAITTFVDAAIGVNGNLWGTVSCTQRGEPRHFTAQEVGMVKRFTDAISLRRAQRRMREAEARGLLGRG